MKELIFVTHNAHKADEVKAIINDTFKIKNLSEINFFEEIPETGNTFQDNALQKAKYLHDKIKCNCFIKFSVIFRLALSMIKSIHLK